MSELEQKETKVSKKKETQESTDSTKKDQSSFTIVKFERGDVVTALYKNNELEFYGDEYHNKARTYIQGFLDGLNSYKIQYTVENITCNIDHINETVVNYGNTPPKNLKDVIEK